jgi:hypothetical protein
VNEEISRQLHEAAGAHRPDGARMLARVERGTAVTNGRHRTPGIARTWPRVAVAGLAAAGILATGGLAVASIIQIAPPRPDSATSVIATSPSVAPTPSTRTIDGSAPPPPPGQTTTSQSTTSQSTSVDPGSTPPADNPVSTGPLSAQGSINPHSQEYWSQSDLILNSTQLLTALTVELRIAQTGSVQTTGQWQTEPNDTFTVTVQEVDGAVVYRWELKPGRTISAAHQTFAAQYNHGNGARDARADTYTVRATADGTHSVQGGFTPAG